MELSGRSQHFFILYYIILYYIITGAGVLDGALWPDAALLYYIMYIILYYIILYYIGAGAGGLDGAVEPDAALLRHEAKKPRRRGPQVRVRLAISLYI